jgi:hypothetical protein
VVFNSSHRFIPQEVAEQRRKESSRLIGVVLAFMVLLAVAAIPVVAFGVMKGRNAAQYLKRSTSIRGIAQGITVAEQSGVKFGPESDWKKTLLEINFVPEEMFQSPAAIDGVMRYRIIWRPQTTKWIGTNSSWLCIHEDPVSLRPGQRVHIIVAPGHVVSTQPENLATVIQDELKELGVELSDREVKEVLKR